jgi:UDP-N-acetylmuramoylalanine-D-glutamate ligase
MRAVRRGRAEHFKDPMKKNCAQYHFTACKPEATLLQTGSETRADLFQSGLSVFSPACSSVDDFFKTLPGG